jgi:hypothetical protein
MDVAAAATHASSIAMFQVSCHCLIVLLLLVLLLLLLAGALP